MVSKTWRERQRNLGVALLSGVGAVLRPDLGDTRDLVVGILLQPLQVAHQVGLLSRVLNHARMVVALQS